MNTESKLSGETSDEAADAVVVALKYEYKNCENGERQNKTKNEKGRVTGSAGRASRAAVREEVVEGIILDSFGGMVKLEEARRDSEEKRASSENSANAQEEAPKNTTNACEKVLLHVLILAWIQLFLNEAENAAQSISSIFVTADSDRIDTHLNNWIIVATWLGHVAKVKNVLFIDFKFFHEMSHAEDFVHAWSDGINGGSATNFVIVSWGEFFGALDDSGAFFMVRVPSVFSFGAGFLAKSREGNLAEAVFDNFITFGKLVGFPVAKFFGGCFDGLGNFGDLLVGKWIAIDLLPLFFLSVEAIILSALSNEKM